MSITSKLLLTIFFCSAQQAKYSRHKQLIMIYRLLADLYKTVKIHHDNTEVKQCNVVLMYSSFIQLLQLGQIRVGRPEFWIQNFELRRWRETVTVATASCVRAYENLDLHSSPVLLQWRSLSRYFEWRFDLRCHMSKVCSMCSCNYI